MRRSAEFDATVKYGIRKVLPDVIVHVRRATEGTEDYAVDEARGPRMGLIVAKPVGCAVERHRVARRLRHVARPLLAGLHPSDQVVIRALPSSRQVSSARLAQQVRSGLRRAFDLAGADR